MNYESEKEIHAVVRAFENGTISRTDWGHAEHLLVAAHYAVQHDFETTLAKMRAGIFNLLEAFNVDLSKEMPYHETLTVFWLRRIFELKTIHKNLRFLDLANTILRECADKDLPLKFYSRELLFSPEARRKFVAADIEIADAV